MFISVLFYLARFIRKRDFARKLIFIPRFTVVDFSEGVGFELLFRGSDSILNFKKQL